MTESDDKLPGRSCGLDVYEDRELRAELIIECLRCKDEDCLVRMTALKPYLEARKFVDDHVAH